jgi:hypothetical protein
MLDLGGADAEGERPEGAMRRSVAVAADDRRAGQREALLGADDMDDALLRSDRVDIGDPEFGGVALERGELLRRLQVGDRQPAAIGGDPRGGRDIMVGYRQGQVGPAHRAAGDAKPFERLRARDFVDQVAVDIDQAGAVVAALDDMRVPDLLVEGAGFRGHAASL